MTQGRPDHLDVSMPTAAEPQTAPVIAYATPAKLSTDVGFWRTGKWVVAAREHRNLPACCFLCGKPAMMFQRQTVSCFWTLEWKNRKVEIRVPMCEMHGKIMGKWIRNAWLYYIFGILGCLLSGCLPDAISPMMGWAGVIMVLMAMMVRIVLNSIIRAKRITPEFVTLKGAGKAFLEQLPEYPEK